MMNTLKYGMLGRPLTSSPVTTVQNVMSSTQNMPPNVKTLLAKYGNASIKYIKINRTPVNSGITYALNMFSKGGKNFNNEFKKLPYESLYHLQLIFSTSAGRCVLEKNERVNMAEQPKETETMDVRFPAGLTINQIYSNGLKLAGNDKFYKYNASSNNCQNFILYLLQGSRLTTPENVAFTKQDTSTLFAKDPKLRKIANSLTTIGAKANIIQQGGTIANDWVKPMSQEAIIQQLKNRKVVQTASGLKPKKAPSAWIQHLKQYRAKNGGSLKDAMKKAKATYKR